MLLTSKSDVSLGIKAAGLRHCVVINVAVICVGEAVPLGPSYLFPYCINGTKDSRATKAVEEGVPGEEKGGQAGGTER